MSGASKNLKNFIDLTADVVGTTVSSLQYNASYAAMDSYSYMDAEKANENIKALLEGAFEEEEEEEQEEGDDDNDDGRTKVVKTRSKKNKKRKLKKKVPAEKSLSPEADDQFNLPSFDDLVSQLQNVTVADADSGAAEPGKGVDSGLKTATEDASDLNATESENKDSAPRHEHEDDDEEEEDDEADEDEDDDEDDDEGAVDGLSVNLLPHQVAGVKWMCEKETGTKKNKGTLPKGGILADDMGLGKTVQTIALILSNRKDDSQREETPGTSKCTLVVAPLALIKQWESEIAAKVERDQSLRVCVYHGATRAKATDELEKYDVVITTYGTLTSEHGAAANSNNKRGTGLFSVYWYRIILDEAHSIKNRNAKATQAACDLDAEFRWCLTGTPLQNNLDELQSLIKFLRIKPYNDLAAWRDQISRPLASGRGGLAIQRLQIYLKAFMKRRTKDVLKLNDDLKPKPGGGEDSAARRGRPTGFQITKREVITVDAQFMPGELNLYKRLEQRTENSLEKMIGDSKLDYAGALVLLLRLRQACNHPDLVKSDLARDKDILLQQNDGGGGGGGGGGSQSQSAGTKADELDSVADMLGALTVLSTKCDVCQATLDRQLAKSGASRCSDCENDLQNISLSMGNERQRSRQHVRKASSKKNADCSKERRGHGASPCRSKRNRRVVLDSDDEQEEQDGEWIVPKGERTTTTTSAGETDDEDAEGGGEWLGSEDSATDEDDDEQNESAAAAESDDEDAWVDGQRVLASTKIQRLMEIVRGEAHEHKFIVFSVFTSMLDKVEPFLQRAGIGYARYDGQMRNDQREASLEKLRNQRSTRVLLCSLRAGALGLNLTAASRVVILEPFWNPFVEEQAIDRVHRLNQTVDVKIYKLIIKDTVEERIVDLQNRKRELANMTIEGKTAAAKLTMRDMMALFGRDAESRYASTRHDATMPRRLLTASDDPGSIGDASRSTSRGTSRGTSTSSRRPARERPSRPEDSVYGRRW